VERYKVPVGGGRKRSKPSPQETRKENIVGKEIDHRGMKDTLKSGVQQQFRRVVANKIQLTALAEENTRPTKKKKPRGEGVQTGRTPQRKRLGKLDQTKKEKITVHEGVSLIDT